MRKAIVVAIIALAFLLRVVGSNPGYPPYHSDEGISYSAAVSMIKNNNLDPLRYDYPAVVPLSNHIFFKLVFIPASWLKYFAIHTADIANGVITFPLEDELRDRIMQMEILGERERNALFWGRAVTAVFGTGSVLLVYLIGKRLFGYWAGVAAALLLAVNYRAVLNSHIGLPDTYNAFFLLLAFLAALVLLKEPTRRNYILAGLAAGLSLSTKYQVFAFFPILLVHLFHSWEQKGNSERVKHLFRVDALFVPVLAAFTFVFLNPYAFVKIEETVVEEKADYSICEYSIDKIPPAGLCLYRRQKLLSHVKDYDMFLELDFLYLLVSKGIRKFAYVPKAGLYHHHVKNFRELLKKRRYNLLKVYLARDKRLYTWISLDSISGLFKIAAWILYANLLVPGLITGVYKSIKQKDIAGLYDFLVTPVVTDVIVLSYLAHSFKSK